MTDADLIDHYASQRSEEAFRELVRRNINLVYATALRQVAGDCHLAQDVGQRVFVVLARKAPALRSCTNLAGWLYRTTRLEAARAVRTECRRRKHEQAAEIMKEPPEAQADPPVSWEVVRPVLDQALGSLDEKDREAVLLRFMAGKSFPEVGQVTGLNEDAARKRVERAVDKLRQWLQRRGIASSVSTLATVLEAHASVPAPSNVTATIADGAWRELLKSSTVHAALFMGTSKVTGGIAVVVLGLAAGLIVHDWSSLRSAENKLAQENTDLVATKAKGDQLEHQWAALSSKPPSQATQTKTHPPAAPSYFSSPDYRALSKEYSRARLQLNFQRLYRRLVLSPQQIDRFEAVMMAQDQANIDAKAARAAGEDTKPIYEKSGKEWSTAMTDLLGTSGFAQLQDYLGTVPVRQFVDRLATEIPANGAPLTLDQSDKVAQLALLNDMTYQQGRGTDPGTVNWDAVWKPAEQILNGQQLRTLQTMVESWTLDHQISMRVTTVPEK